MNRLKQLKTYPFGLLLCLEWILLGSAILGELPDSFLWGQNDQASVSVFLSSIFSFLCLISLGLIGLRLPTKNTLNKWLYLLLQLGLMWLPVIINKQALPLFTPCLIVVMRNCLIFKLGERRLANILVFISVIPSLTYINTFTEFQTILSQYQAVSLAEFEIRRNVGNISYLFLNGLLITFICILVNALLKEYQSQQQLAQAREQLRQYAIQAEDRAAVNERNRIAREIHDSVGHALTAQTIQLNNAIAFWQSQPDKAYQFLTEAKELVTTALKEIRYSINTLRSDPLEGKSLEDAIALLFEEFSSRTKIIPDHTMILNHSLSEEIK
ncbi:MAG: sensor histidine kinase, partial [Waterburya sp.]